MFQEDEQLFNENLQVCFLNFNVGTGERPRAPATDEKNPRCIAWVSMEMEQRTVLVFGVTHRPRPTVPRGGSHRAQGRLTTNISIVTSNNENEF